MYSILIRDEVDATKWRYQLDEDEAVWTGSLDEAKEEVIKLLAVVVKGRIKVVHNTNIDFTGITIKDVEE